MAFTATYEKVVRLFDDYQNNTGTDITIEIPYYYSTKYYREPKAVEMQVIIKAFIKTYSKFPISTCFFFHVQILEQSI